VAWREAVSWTLGFRCRSWPRCSAPWPREPFGLVGPRAGGSSARRLRSRFGNSGGRPVCCPSSQREGEAGAPPEPSMCKHVRVRVAPSSSSGPGRRPFKAVARVRIPLGARPGSYRTRSRGAARSARRPVKAEVAGSNPVGTAQPLFPGHRERAGAGSSVGTSVRLKSGRSAVRPRPCPPSMTRRIAWSSLVSRLCRSCTCPTARDR
jgi:hypothetical protein